MQWQHFPSLFIITRFGFCVSSVTTRSNFSPGRSVRGCRGQSGGCGAGLCARPPSPPHTRAAPAAAPEPSPNGGCQPLLLMLSSQWESSRREIIVIMFLNETGNGGGRAAFHTQG